MMARTHFPDLPGQVMGVALMALATMPANAQMEFQVQHGSLLNPFSGSKASTTILTLQHAGGWRYGDSFFFLDLADDNKSDGFNDKDAYGEWYPTMSLGKLSGKAITLGPIRDVALIAGVNYGADTNILKFLPGLRLSWSVPGFLFLNSDFCASFDHSGGVASGGAPGTNTGWTIDVSWALPFMIGGQSFAVAGHAEYVASVTNEFGDKVLESILAQPQFTWDLGAALGGANHLLVGIELQYWRQKLGVTRSETVPQLLAIWRL